MTSDYPLSSSPRRRDAPSPCAYLHLIATRAHLPPFHGDIPKPPRPSFIDKGLWTRPPPPRPPFTFVLINFLLVCPFSSRRRRMVRVALFNGAGAMVDFAVTLLSTMLPVFGLDGRNRYSSSPSATYLSPRRLNGRNTFPGDEVEVESEPSDAESNPPLRSPSGVGLEDEIVVDAQDAKLPEPTPPVAAAATPEDVTMDDAHDPSAVSHYPKRKRNSLYQDLSETRMESSQPSPQPRDGKKAKGSKEGTVKVATLGWWRDSNVPELHQKHVVVGFIDIRDRLRTRIQPQTMAGEPLTGYPLPPGPGGSWVTFERIIFSDHLVGLDHAQVKEYTRLRCEVRHAEADEERAVTEAEAVREAMRRVRENPAYDNPAVPPPIARGVDLASRHALPTRADSKRRKTNNGFSILGSTPRTTPAPEPGLAKPSPQPMSAHQNRFSIDPLPGTRPTRILIGHWSGSSEPDLRDRHAVYGILGQNDMFRVKVVRETRDGRFVDGNFPTGAGALWIPYEEVGFDAHLVGLSRQEVKEYCRVRQYQLDHKEQEADREANERKAVAEAKARAGATFKLPAAPDAPEALERTSAIARREIARVEAAQSRADLHALSRERAAAAAAGATTAAAAAAAAAASSPTVLSNGRALFHESDEMRRLNKVWARQESIRVKAGAEDAKMYDGVKYERKATGPFMGKLVSQGTIINIDGDDYVEYRVLTKPSFF
ncbi:hypothetical protein DCS_02384 [Drechmeria coniospora]|uniref:tRNA splicing endonuclease subunit n=1 Tax=Drechmeria coniospora TaxID=98403 RepID=A0A151GW36_DRECN|nr:hypothetical protein DCS_02384 [Drechmeria coniospora]KYK61242.1 hypothetical protein DCS_02384 [Drechmeria coniospora]